MSSNTRQAFLEDILAHPDDDAPRLIFADWLEEEGDSDRAEFIRVQVDRVRLPQWDARQVRLRLRESTLLKAHGQKWKQELPAIVGITWDEFRRGFVAGAKCDSFDVLEENASQCWSATPLEALGVPGPNDYEAIQNMRPIPALRELSLDEIYYEYYPIERLAYAPLLSTVRVLSAPNCNLGVEGFRCLIGSPHLGNLKSLRMSSNSIGNSGIEVLVEAASLTSLTELDLSNWGDAGRYNEDPVINANGLKALAAWPGLAGLRSLRLSGNNVDRSGLQSLLESPRIVGLKELELRNTGLVGQAMLEFGFSRPEMQLDVLDLGVNLLLAFGAENLATASCLRELKVLTIDQCEINTAAPLELAGATFLSSLRMLNVDHNSLGPEGLNELLEMKPPWLHTLKMVNNDLGDEGASYLAQLPALETLVELDLSENGLGKYAAAALASSEYLQNLVVLRLNSNELDRSARAELSESSLGKRLAVLDLEDDP
jgi:uncharacterized protein (TIGR02996 family)